MNRYYKDALKSHARGIKQLWDDRIVRVLSVATFDLYNGPVSPEEYEFTGATTLDGKPVRGFQSACKAIREELEAWGISPVWADGGSGTVYDNEPDWSVEDSTEWSYLSTEAIETELLGALRGYV